MKIKYNELPYSLADWTFTKLVVVLGVIVISINWFVKRAIWEIKQPMGRVWIYRVLLLLVILWVFEIGATQYRGVYLNPVKKILSDKEVLIKKLQNEVYEKEQELKKWEGLKTGDKASVIAYIQKKFGSNWKMAVATFKAESGLRCGIVQDWMNYDKSADYGIAQINSTHLWMVDNEPERLLDCKTNIDVAYRVWDRADGKEGNKQGSFTPWVAYNDGRADQFLSSL